MIELTIADDVATIVLNAPRKLNALNMDDLEELSRVYLEAERAEVRALVAVSYTHLTLPTIYSV